jgi:hypothetical protein
MVKDVVRKEAYYQDFEMDYIVDDSNGFGYKSSKWKITLALKAVMSLCLYMKSTYQNNDN